MSGLDPQAQPPAAAGADDTQMASLSIKSYLDATVVPVLLQGLAELTRVRPENPVDYLGMQRLFPSKLHAFLVVWETHNGAKVL